MTRGVVFAGIAMIAASPSPADACSCAPELVVVSPVDGATSVPLNAVIIVRNAYGPVLLQNTATQEWIPVQVETRGAGHVQTGDTVFARPSAPLEANTTYVIGVGSDPGLPGYRRTTFTTGDALDEAPPAFAGLSSLSPETMTYPIPDDDGSYCASSCVTVVDHHISRLRFDFDEPPADVVYLELEVLDASHEPLELLPLASTATHVFGFDYCSTRSPILTPGTEYCARLVGYDAAGNMAGQSTELCSAAATCAPRLRPDMLSCEPVDECLPAPDEGGCTTSGGSGGCAPALALLGLALVIRRRR